MVWWRASARQGGEVTLGNRRRGGWWQRLPRAHRVVSPRARGLLDAPLPTQRGFRAVRGGSSRQHLEAVLEEDGELAAGLVPKGRRCLPLALSVAQGHVERPGGGLVGGEAPARRHGAPHATVQALDRIGRADHLANRCGEREERPTCSQWASRLRAMAGCLRPGSLFRRASSACRPICAISARKTPLRALASGLRSL